MNSSLGTFRDLSEDSSRNFLGCPPKISLLIPFGTEISAVFLLEFFGNFSRNPSLNSSIGYPRISPQVLLEIPLWIPLKIALRTSSGVSLRNSVGVPK